MNTIDEYIILAALLGLLAGCAIGYWSGYSTGVNTGYERCRWRRIVRERNRRDPSTGRWRKVP